jgi:hypothetical protein
VVQVSVFKSKKMAENLVAKLANEGYPAYVSEVENPTPELSGVYHRVRVGNFARVADANAFGQDVLKSMGYDFWVDNKSHEGSSSASVSSEPAAPQEAKEPRHGNRKKKKNAEAQSETAPESGFSSTPTEPAIPNSEPVAPSSESWGTPAVEPAAPSMPKEPATPPPAPSSESWGAPAGEPAAPNTPSTPDTSAKPSSKDAW